MKKDTILSEFALLLTFSIEAVLPIILNINPITTIFWELMIISMVLLFVLCINREITYFKTILVVVMLSSGLLCSLSGLYYGIQHFIEFILEVVS